MATVRNVSSLLALGGVLLCAACGGGGGDGPTPPVVVPPVTRGPAPALHVQGNALATPTGTIRLKGVNHSGSEYACIQGWGIFDGPSDAASVNAIASWQANAVRIQLNEDCWLNINGVKPAYGGANYQNAIINYVNLLHQAGMYAILSLAYNAPGTTPAAGRWRSPSGSAPRTAP